MDLTVGLGGHEHHSCVALCGGGTFLGACEQERVTRVRAAGPNRTGMPDEALDLLLDRSGHGREAIARFTWAEPFDVGGLSGPAETLDHHLGHAAAAYLTSPHTEAAVLVIDHESPGASVWRGKGGVLERLEWPSHGAGLATLYSDCASALGFTGTGHAQHFEALARLMPAAHDGRVEALFELHDHTIRPAADWMSQIQSMQRGLQVASPESQALASAVQVRLGELLLSMLAAVRRSTGEATLCVGGSLFYNTYFSSLVKQSPLFDRVFVPINPGNAGLAVGAALYTTGAPPRTVSPFLGPAFSADEIKATLDNCKLQYDWVTEAEVIDRAVAALRHGYLVGWYDGPMEWGPRALGARCILASPFSPYVLQNLNQFLKHRLPWRGYALSGLEDDIQRLFDGPDASPYMECDYKARDRELFRHVLPQPDAALRVQTVGQAVPPRFRALLQAFGEATGAAVLVSTSFNGFSEPIVCTARDAVRVYYGTGLDMLVLDRFVLAK